MNLCEMCIAINTFGDLNWSVGTLRFWGHYQYVSCDPNHDSDVTLCNMHITLIILRPFKLYINEKETSRMYQFEQRLHCVGNILWNVAIAYLVKSVVNLVIL